MRLFYHKDFHNFGDVMNPWFWDHFIPGLSEIGDDDIIFSGIGSILNDRLPIGRQNVVFGSGAGYGSAPGSGNWKFYAVRGAETAKVFGLSDIALGDPAILLPLIVPVPAADPGEIVFVPHRESAALGGWSRPCEALGIKYVDPRSELLDVIRSISTARLVIAESLHGAIVADAYRVPWVPVIMFHAHPFKWNDWLGALDLEYSPSIIDQRANDQLRSPPLKLTRKLHRKLQKLAMDQRAISELAGQGARIVTKAMRAAVLESEATFDGRVRDLGEILKSGASNLSHPKILKARQQGLLDQIEVFRTDWGLT